MAFGDIGGPVTELVITCKTYIEGLLAIEKGDAVAMVGNYVVSNKQSAELPVIGQALAQDTFGEKAIPVRVKGVNVYRYVGEMPFGVFHCYLYGLGVVLSCEVPGAVEFSERGTGKILAFNPDSKTVHVLH